MAVKIVVLSDGTWQSVNTAQVVQVLTITDSAYDCLVDGILETSDLKQGTDILETKDVDT